MEHTLEHRIRQRAYEIWHAHGQDQGKADEHWLAAEREILSSVRAQAPAINASTPAKSAKRTRGAAQRTTKPSKMPALGRSRS